MNVAPHESTAPYAGPGSATDSGTDTERVPGDHVVTVPVAGRPPATVAVAPRPPRSAAAAALLNLTGLGAGFGYLGRWGRAAACAAVSAVLVAVAFATDAADRPVLWQAVAAAWLGAAAAAAWWTAQRDHPRPLTTAARVTPVLWAVVAVGVLVTGHVGYSAAGSAVFSAGLDAHADADCPTAIGNYDTVDGLFELALSADVRAARANRAQCAAFQAAAGAADRHDYAEAVRLYRDFGTQFPGTLLVGVARSNLEDAYFAWAGQLRGAGDLPGAVRVYRELLGVADSERARSELADTYLEQATGFGEAAGSGAGTERAVQARSAITVLAAVVSEFGQTPAAQRAPQVVGEVVAAAGGLFAEQKYCEALPVLDYFVTLPASAPTTGVADAAHPQRAAAMLECGLGEYRGAAYADAVDQLDAFLAAYPNDPQAALGRSAAIAARVLEQDASTAVPVPAPVTDNAPGSIPVTFTNDSREEQHVYVAGPTAHEFVLPPCPGCPESYGSVRPRGVEPCGAPAERPSLTLYLVPGTYLSYSDAPSDDTAVTSRVVEPGWEYSTCIYSGTLY